MDQVLPLGRKLLTIAVDLDDFSRSNTEAAENLAVTGEGGGQTTR